jgi:plastocyanin
MKQRLTGARRAAVRILIVISLVSLAFVVCLVVPSASSGKGLTSVPSAILGPAAVGAGAANGSIRGRVDLRRPPSLTDRRPNVSDLGAGARRDLTDRLRSVVYLEAAPRGAFEQADLPRAVMNQRNETFVPHVLAIMTGTTVEFPNSDRIYHNVFSLSKPATFDLGRYAAGRSKSVRFDRPGIVRVFCEIHSHMSAFILVFGHPFFAMTDGDGAYRLNNIPAGTYNVIAWNEGISSDPAPVSVPSGGAAELDITIR